MNDNISQLLNRTNLRIPFKEFLKEVELQYPQFGKILRFEAIVIGYEDANILLMTQTGRYVIKIFLKERSIGNIQSYIRILEEARKAGVPVMQLVAGKQGVLNHVPADTWYFISDFFEGRDFQQSMPTIDDMVLVVGLLATLNTLHFPVIEAYDSWGNKNLLAEYAKNKQKLTSDQNFLIAPIIEEVRKLDFSKFSTAVIHGDMQRKHVLKNTNGEYCLLDFGCAAHGPKVIELSTYLAWFCLGRDTWEKKKTIMKKVIARYCGIHILTSYELDALPFLIRAVYAAYFLKTSILMAEGDMSQQTCDWYDSSSHMLQLMAQK